MRIRLVAATLAMVGSFGCSGAKSEGHSEAGSDLDAESGLKTGSDSRAESGANRASDAGAESRTDTGVESTADAGPDASFPLGAAYVCGGGDGGLDGGGDTPCIVGQTYCFVLLPRPLTLGTPAYSCKSYADLTASCDINPTCECLCAHGYHCQTECRCSESSGFATVSCEPI
jgi:hypothetical protein